jgi:hypothetical protein
MAHRVVTVTNPGAGAEWSSTVPAGKYWGVRSGSFIFTTDGTVATRNVRLQLDDSSITYFISDTDAGQAAGLGIRYSFFAGGLTTNAGATSTPRLLSYPPIVLLPGHRIRTTTGNIQAADAYTSIILMVDERDAEFEFRYGVALPWVL